MGRGGSVVPGILYPGLLGIRPSPGASPCDLFTTCSCVFRNWVENEAASLGKARVNKAHA